MRTRAAACPVASGPGVDSKPSLLLFGSDELQFVFADPSRERCRGRRGARSGCSVDASTRFLIEVPPAAKGVLSFLGPLTPAATHIGFEVAEPCRPGRGSTTVGECTRSTSRAEHRAGPPRRVENDARRLPHAPLA